MIRAIVSSNDNPMYLDFWPIVAKVWKSFGIQPTLAYIGKRDAIFDSIDKTIGDVYQFESLCNTSENVSDALYAQCVRLLLPVAFPNDTCIVSDIDIIPMNKKFFLDPMKLPLDTFINYNSNHPDCPDDQIMMCYVAATGKTFSEIFGAKTTLDIPAIVSKWNTMYNGEKKWFTDQLNLHKHVGLWLQKNDNNIKRYKQLGLYNTEVRIDRENWGYDEQLVKDGFYMDAHCLRPYKENKEEIDKLINLL